MSLAIFPHINLMIINPIRLDFVLMGQDCFLFIYFVVAVVVDASSRAKCTFA